MSCKRWLWVVLGVFAMHVQAEYQELDAIVAIVGDLNATDVINWATEYFSDIPPGESPPPVHPPEPEQRGERRRASRPPARWTLWAGQGPR